MKTVNHDLLGLLDLKPRMPHVTGLPAQAFVRPLSQTARRTEGFLLPPIPRRRLMTVMGVLEESSLQIPNPPLEPLPLRFERLFLFPKLTPQIPDRFLLIRHELAKPGIAPENSEIPRGQPNLVPPAVSVVGHYILSCKIRNPWGS